MEYISTAELALLGSLTLMSIVMITFSKDVKFPFVGAFILGLIMMIVYVDHRDYLNQAFVLKRFQEGHTIECGLWKGERALINPKSGWTYLQGAGFIKGDLVRNDLGQCNVMGEEAHKPSNVPYAFAWIVELMLVFGLRAAVQKQLNEEDADDNI